MVDDDRSISDGLRELLGRYDFYVRAAGDREQARWEMARDAFDVLVLDWLMPEGNGRQILEDARRTIPEMEVVVYSGFDTSDGDSARCIVIGKVTDRPVRPRPDAAGGEARCP